MPLRPLGVGELLDGALGLIRSNPRTVLGLAAAISAVSALIQTVGVWIGLSALGATSVSLTGSGTLSTDLTALTASSAAQLVPALIAGFLQVLASGLFIVLVGAAVLGRRLDAGQTWAELRPRLLALIAVSLLVFLGVLAVIAVLVGGVIGLVAAFGEWAALPGVLLVLAGGVAAVYAYVRLALASPALVMEGLGPMASLRRSWRLVRGSWWRVAGILLLAAIITNLLTTIVSVPLSLVAAVVTGVSESMLPTVLAAGLATLLAGIVTLPFTAAVTGLLYTDLRMRREALDIELVSAGVDPQADPLAAYRRGR
ncbi:MAG TPA: glycerophosphoryl diester phosphodiesterase membrane domain-containing protein [Candidatus Nanopelagicales bacterium]